MLYFGIPKFTGSPIDPESLLDLWLFAVPFAYVGLIELLTVDQIGSIFTGHTSGKLVLDNPPIVAVSDFILLFPIFVVISFIVDSARRRDQTKIDETNNLEMPG